MVCIFIIVSFYQSVAGIIISISSIRKKYNRSCTKYLPLLSYHSMIFKKDGQSDLPIGEYYAKEPNVNVRNVIKRLLRVVPQECLEGLGGIILCDATKFKEHYGDNEKVSSARYIRIKDDSESPWIEICVNWYIGGFPKWVLRISAITDLAFSSPLYHEIGHHIVRESGNRDEDTEEEAEKWGKKFERRYMLRYHFVFTFLVLIIIFPFRKRLAKICGYKQYEQI